MNPILIIGLVVILILYKFLTSKGSLNSVDAKKIVAEGGKVIDVRSPGEYKSGHNKVAVNIPHDNISSGVKKLKLGKDTPMILYCASGMRSRVAISTLKAEGFTNVHNAGTLQKINSLLG